MRRVALALILSTCLSGAAGAQLVPALNSKPEAYAKPSKIPAARDVACPGTVQLTVDATDVTRGIFRIHETVPVSGEGDLVLVEARPEEFRELSRFHAIEGKTWNYPALAAGKLLVRNGAEMACFEIAK